MYFLLRPNPNGAEYSVFVDVKDTRGKERLSKMEEIFKNYHLGDSPFLRFQNLRSHDSVFFQLTDFFIGAIGYKSRREIGELSENALKDELVRYIEGKSGFLLNEGTPIWESKFNVFDFQPKSISK